MPSDGKGGVRGGCAGHAAFLPGCVLGWESAAGGRAGVIRADAVGTQETEETLSLYSSHYVQGKKRGKPKLSFNFFNLEDTLENSSDH